MTICAWCGSTRPTRASQPPRPAGAGAPAPVQAAPAAVSHGICPSCLEKRLAPLRAAA